MANPATTAPHGEAPGEGHAVEHHGSWAPIIIASSVGFLYLGILALQHDFARVALPIGLLVFTVGLVWWIREDVLRFRTAVAHAPAETHKPGPWVGMALFIGTEVLIFGSIFAVWFVGSNHAGVDGRAWRPDVLHLPITATAINTAVLVASGATLHWGMLGLKHGNAARFKIGLLLTLILGGAFLVQQAREYVELVEIDGMTIEGFRMEAGDYCHTTKEFLAEDGVCPDVYGSSFFMLTGTHGLHVFGGLLFLFIVFLRTLVKTQSREHHIATETAAMYWHFVDVVWLFLFAVVYLEWL